MSSGYLFPWHTLAIQQANPPCAHEEEGLVYLYRYMYMYMTEVTEQQWHWLVRSVWRCHGRELFDGCSDTESSVFALFGAGSWKRTLLREWCIGLPGWNIFYAELANFLCQARPYQPHGVAVFMFEFVLVLARKGERADRRERNPSSTCGQVLFDANNNANLYLTRSTCTNSLNQSSCNAQLRAGACAVL